MRTFLLSCRWPPYEDAGAARPSSCKGTGLEKLSEHVYITQQHTTPCGTMHHGERDAARAAPASDQGRSWTAGVDGLRQLVCCRMVRGEQQCVQCVAAEQRRALATQQPATWRKRLAAACGTLKVVADVVQWLGCGAAVNAADAGADACSAVRWHCGKHWRWRRQAAVHHG